VCQRDPEQDGLPIGHVRKKFWVAFKIAHDVQKGILT